VKVYGVDFTSAPQRSKPIVAAACELAERRLVLRDFLEFSDWPAYELWLGRDDQWIAGFDFPFGLPRRFVDAQGWPRDWASMVRACAGIGKEAFSRIAMRAFQDAQLTADKHRATDLAARSESPLKTMANPPVGKMFYEGSWRLVSSRLHVAALHETGSKKIALEAYPGLLVRRLGETYYKNDKPSNADRNAAARRRILDALRAGRHPQGKLKLELASRRLASALQDPSGDWLDAVLCAVQAADASSKRKFGLPDRIEPCEGWIVSA